MNIKTLASDVLRLVGGESNLIKDTSLAFILNVPELTTLVGQVNNRVQVYPTILFVFTGLVYYLICTGLTHLLPRQKKIS